MTGNDASPQKRRRGRPIGFDRRLALQRAGRLFWERGFEGTSFDDLVDAMAISPSSFYAAFGGKERLYLEAVDAYAAEAAAWITGELDGAADAATALRNVLGGAADMLTRAGQPPGCMISAACTALPPRFEPLREHLAGLRRGAEARMAARIRRGIRDGDTPPDADPDALASFYNAVLRGMAVQARDGAARERLREIVDIALQAWPRLREAETSGARDLDTGEPPPRGP